MVKLAVGVAGGSGATYPFLPQLPFMQLEYKWGANWHSKLWLAYGFICFPSMPQCSAKQSYLILPGVATVVENISPPSIKVLKVLKANI